MISRHPFLAALVSSTVLLALTGCGKSASDEAVSVATGGKVQVSHSGDASQVTVKDDKGNEVKMNSGDNVPLPKDFPSDVHLPAGYKVRNAVSAPQAVMLDLHTPATAQAVFSEYDSAMKAAGWTEAMAIQSPDSGSSLTFTKQKRNVVVVIRSGEGGTDVHVQSASE